MVAKAAQGTDLVKTWLAFSVFVFALWLRRRLAPDRLVECDRAPDW